MPSFHKHSNLRKIAEKRAQGNDTALELSQTKTKPKNIDEFEDKPVQFAIDWLRFKPTPYQVELLEDKSKRIVVIFPRQSGKTTTLSVRMIWYAATHPKTVCLIVAPGLRQSMIVMDRIHAFLMGMGKADRRAIISRMQRTVVWFKRGSQIVALPNSPNLLRGYTAHMVLCFPSGVLVTLADGRQLPIEKVTPNTKILSWNPVSGSIESRKVLRIFARRYNESIAVIRHQFGQIACTPNHRFYTSVGKKDPYSLCVGDQLIFWDTPNASRSAARSDSRASSLRRPSRRLLPFKASNKKKELDAANQPQLKTSRIHSVEILNLSDAYSCTAAHHSEWWLGRPVNTILDACISLLHTRSRPLLPQWQENTDEKVVGKDKAARLGRVVHGRWQPNNKQLEHADCHKFLHQSGTSTASKLANRKMGGQNRSSSRPPWYRLFLGFPRGTARQILRPYQTSHSPIYEVQGRCPTPCLRNLPCVPPKFSAETQYPQDLRSTCPSHVLFGGMPEIRSIEAQIQSTNSLLQDMRCEVHSSHWEPSHLQQRLQPQVPSSSEEREQIHGKIPSILVYNLEVEQNHNYFANGLLVANCDEAAFFREDELVFYNVLFPMLQTTQGTLIASSTPWGKDSVFYKFTQEDAFKKHWIKIDDVITAGLTTQAFVDEMRRRTPTERFRREYLAEFVEDELAYFNQALISQCLDSELAPITDDWTKQVKAPPGRYFLGIDLGKKVDYSVIAILRWNTKEAYAELVGLVRFPLETPYASVIGMVKVICDKLSRVERVLVDQTGVGEYIVEEMKNAHIRSTIEGVMLSVPSKQEILGYMKHLMQTEALGLYMDEDLLGEINVERYELTKTGQIQFSHPDGTHDDELWALALGIYATRTPDTSYMGKVYGVPKG